MGRWSTTSLLPCALASLLSSAAVEAEPPSASAFADVAGGVVLRVGARAAVLAAFVAVYAIAAALVAVDVLHHRAAVAAGGAVIVVTSPW